MPAAKVQPSLDLDFWGFLRVMSWNMLITGNCAGDLCIYLQFLEEFKENNGLRWNFARSLKTSASSCKIVTQLRVTSLFTGFCN